MGDTFLFHYIFTFSNSEICLCAITHQAAVTKYYRLSDLNNRNSFLIVLEAKKPEMKVQADSLLMKALLSACRQLLSLCVLTWW